MEHTCVVIFKCYSMNSGKDCEMSEIENKKCIYQQKTTDKKYNICTHKTIHREVLWEETQVYI